MLLNLDYTVFEIPETDITIEIKPLSVEAYQGILSIMAKMNLSGDAVESGLEQMSSPEILKLASELIPKFTRNLKGISIRENGSVIDATIEDLLKHGALLQICFTVIMQLFSISSITKEETSKVKK